MDPFLRMMAVGYMLTVAIELPTLLIGLSRRHSIVHRIFAGFWLTACTYPILWLVLPEFIDPATNRPLYLTVGETFVPIAECVLFWLAFGRTQPRSRAATVRDCAAIVIANLLSFGLGEVFHRTVGWDWLF
jgi:hypothetical protein